MAEPRWSVPTSIDAYALTTASWSTLVQIAFPLSLGFSEREVARQLELPLKQIVERLNELRDELRAGVVEAVDGSETTPRPHQHGI
jgi:protein-arginine kinase